MQEAKNRIHSQQQIIMSMPEFKPITIQDKEIITSYIASSEQRDCDFSFANLCSWHFISGASYSIIHQQLVICFINADGCREYFMPFGHGCLVPVVETLNTIAGQRSEPLCLRGIFPEMQEKLEQYFPTLFDYTTDRDYFDYLYLRQDLSELKGKNYQAKRNHVNKFRKEYEFTYEPLTPDAIPACLEFEATWCMKHGYVENENIRHERRAMTFALDHFKELDLRGAIIRTEGKLIAFTFGSAINYDTFGVHYEKADISYDGIYSAINQHFASHLPDQYTFLNREEDLGISGLRQAKLSYHPVMLLEKGKAIKKRIL